VTEVTGTTDYGPQVILTRSGYGGPARTEKSPVVLSSTKKLEMSRLLDMTEERWHGHVCFRRNVGLRPVRPSDILSDVSTQRITNPLGALIGRDSVEAGIIPDL